MSVRQRLIIGTAATVAVAGSAIGIGLSQAPEYSATSVQVDDTAEILYEPDLLAGIGDVRFYEPTTVAIFTHQGEHNEPDDRALNDAVLAHARESRTEWLSANEQRFADDLYLFAVDPEGRFVGTYFGENRTISRGAQEAIQDAVREDLRDGRWTEGSIVGVQEAADRMNAPFLRTTGGTVMSIFGGLAAAIGGLSYWYVGRRRAVQGKEARAEGDTAMANVVRDMDTTEMHARLIPEESRYGGLMLTRFDEYTKGFAELTDLGNRARGIPESRYDSKEALATLTEYRDKAVELDALDDVIADTAALLNRDRAWPQAWDRQVAPLRTDLQAVDDLLTEDLPSEVRDTDEAKELRSFASTALAEVEQLRGELEHERVSPDDALDRLRDIGDQLSGHLDTLAGVVAREASEDETEQEMMREAMRSERSDYVPQPTILTTTNPTMTWWALSSFRSGYSKGASDVQASQTSSSSSGGSTAGYSSGGSFSGSGSSSRF